MESTQRAFREPASSERRRVDLVWEPSHALVGDPADAIRALKRRDGANLLTWGSGDMARQLLAAGLVDELRLMIYPVVLGRGKRLFDDNARSAAFTLADSISTSTGVTVNRYVYGGEECTGSFEDAEEEAPRPFTIRTPRPHSGMRPDSTERS